MQTDDEYLDEMNGGRYTATALISRIQKKRLDLMEQLLDHMGGRNHLSENDVLRYSAMVEVLKAVLQ